MAYRKQFLRLIFSFFLAPLLLFPLPGQAVSEYEDEIIQSIEDIKKANIGESIKSISDIVAKYPNSKLGHLMLADLLSMRSGSKGLIKQFSEDKKQLNGLRDEIKYRWQHQTANSPAFSGLIPSNLIQPAKNHEHILVVDASQARLFIYKNDNGSYSFVDSYYMTVGKAGMDKQKEGDLRTPVGVYFVTSYLPGEDLPPRYGPGAFPIDYPNILDKLRKKTGYGIWIHGTEPENYNRVPLASDGCVSLSNDEFLDIKQYIKTDGSTPVIIADEFTWADQGTILQSRKEMNRLINQWKADWESLDTQKYLSHYSSEYFNNGKHDYQGWATHKTRVNKHKKYIKIGISDLSIYTYPDAKDMLVVSFRQDYKSDTYKSQSKKKQFWQKNDQGEWKIIYEG